MIRMDSPARRGCRKTRLTPGLDPRPGFTLIEVLLAAVITLLMMGGVVTMFGFVTTKVTQSRAVLEMVGQLRNAKQRLQLDLSGATAPTIPPLDPRKAQGYFELIEGPIGPVFTYGNSMGTSLSPSSPTGADYSVGDCDDILMFTSRGINEDFVGRAAPAASKNLSFGLIRSPLAEICWYMRAGTLYRRVLLVRPSMGPGNYYYSTYDLSMHQEGGQYDYRSPPPGTYSASMGTFFPMVMPNTLGDLTKREYRYGHQPLIWPYDARFWGRVVGPKGTQINRPGLGLPTLYESGSSYWPFPYFGPEYPTQRTKPPAGYVTPEAGNPRDPRQVYIVPGGTSVTSTGFRTVSAGALALSGGSYSGWANNAFVYKGTSTSATIPGFSYGRYDDVVMNHVLSFDVKAWDPGAPIFQVQTSAAGTLGQYTGILPGDPGFNTALTRFISSPAPTNPVVKLSSLGAYVDLNYMWYGGHANSYPSALVKYARTLYGNNKAQMPTLPSYFSYYNLSNWAVFIPGTGPLMPLPWFHYPSNPASGIAAIPSGVSTTAFLGNMASVWDTWSTHYEYDGIDNDNDGLVDEGRDRIDNVNNKIIPYNAMSTLASPIATQAFASPGVDDPTELEAPPPYRFPLRGVQVKIRAFEPDTKQVREVTLVHEFIQE